MGFRHLHLYVQYLCELSPPYSLLLYKSFSQSVILVFRYEFIYFLCDDKPSTLSLFPHVLYNMRIHIPARKLHRHACSLLSFLMLYIVIISTCKAHQVHMQSEFNSPCVHKFLLLPSSATYFRFLPFHNSMHFCQFVIIMKAMHICPMFILSRHFTLNAFVNFVPYNEYTHA